MLSVKYKINIASFGLILQMQSSYSLRNDFAPKRGHFYWKELTLNEKGVKNENERVSCPESIHTYKYLVDTCAHTNE